MSKFSRWNWVWILPLTFISVLLVSRHKTEAFEPALRAIPRPYIVQVISPEHSVVGELKGTSTGRTPFEIAADLGANPYEKDRLSAFPDLKMDIGSQITMQQTPAYKVADGKKKYEFRSWVPTVGELLTENSIELGLEDKINFSADTELIPGMSINIIRVARTTVIEKEAIDYKTKKIDDPTLDKGKTKTKQVGKKGERFFSYEVIREDGVQISKTLKKTEITKEPVEEIILVGTKPVITVRCKYNDTVIAAATKYNYDPDKLCNLMMKESNGHADSVAGGGYKGLFQYEDGFWADASKKAGYSGASIFDPTAQIYTTAWAFTHGYSGRW